MHEAAWKGHDKCVQVLLNARSPAKPRTRKNETPADLARTNGHWELADMLDDFEDYGKVESFEEDWLHLDINRALAIELLKSEGARDGTFLVRKRHNKSGIYVLSLLHDLKTYHFEIVKQGIYFFLDQGPYLLSLEHVVDHYKRFSDGLPCSLKHAIGRRRRRRESAAKVHFYRRTSSIFPGVKPELHPHHPTAAPRVSKRKTNLRRPSNLKSVGPNSRPYVNSETLKRVRRSHALDIPR